MGWKIYFWITLLLDFLSILALFPHGNSTLIIKYLLLTIAELIPLYAYSYKKFKINPFHWKILFWTFIVYTILFNIHVFKPIKILAPLLDFRVANVTFTPALLILTFILSIPYFYALFKLGYRNKEVYFKKQKNKKSFLDGTHSTELLLIIGSILIIITVSGIYLGLNYFFKAKAFDDKVVATEEMSPKDLDYLQSKLNLINKDTTPDELVNILGYPHTSKSLVVYDSYYYYCPTGKSLTCNIKIDFLNGGAYRIIWLDLNRFSYSRYLQMDTLETNPQIEDIRAKFRQIYNETNWDPTSELLWGYFFIDESDLKLQALENKLSKNGLTIVDIQYSETEKMYVLHMEEKKTYNPEQLYDKLNFLSNTASESGIQIFDGWDVAEPIPETENEDSST